MFRTATLMLDLIRKPALVALLGLIVARSEATAADGAGANGGAARKPNVVVILSDDK